MSERFKGEILHFLMGQDRVLSIPTTGGVSTNVNPVFTSSATIEAEISTTKGGANQLILQRYSSSKGFILYLNANGYLCLDGRDGSGTYRTCRDTTTKLNTGAWRKVKGTIDNNIWRVYADEVLLREVNTGYMTTDLNGSSTTFVGNESTIGQFVGAMENVRLWRGAELVLDYRMDALTTDGLLADSSLYTHHGTISGSATLTDK